jgi:hypothetical protein
VSSGALIVVMRTNREMEMAIKKWPALNIRKAGL